MVRQYDVTSCSKEAVLEFGYVLLYTLQGTPGNNTEPGKTFNKGGIGVPKGGGGPDGPAVSIDNSCCADTDEVYSSGRC